MLEDSVIDVISREKKYPRENISLESDLGEIGIDSLEAISILYELEKELDVDLPNESFSTIHTVGDIVEKLRQLTANGIA